MTWSHPFLADPGRPVILASASPRRADILRAQGLSFTVQAAEIDETALPGEQPGPHVERLALTKARTVSVDHPAALVLGFDTIVVIDGEILGKPLDGDDACAMLTRLSGRTHVVYSSAALVCAETGVSGVGHATTKVRFRELGADEIRAYVAHGEPMDKAGAWGIQGVGAMLVAHLDGGYFTVMGLPLGCLREQWTMIFGPAPGIAS